MNQFFYKEINKYESLIKNIEIISFDIFDTLLIRPYLEPTDLFRHIEILYNVPGFVHERIMAENRAKYKSGKESVSIDEIYYEIQDKYKFLKDKELEIESRVLSPNPVMRRIYETALQKGKRIIAISDMYLQEDFLRKLLEKNGYSKIDKIYVSSEIGMCKHSRNLYQYVCNDLEVTPQQILHIGDDISSDFIKAKESGLNALHVDKYINKFNKTIWGKRFLRLGEKYNSLDFSVLKSIIAQYIVFSGNNDYWYTLAYILGGILALGYVQFIDKRSQFFDIKQLLFISRDGYLLEKIYNLYAENPVKTQYIYAPRILNLKCFCDFRGNQEYFNTIVKFINEEGTELKYNPKVDNMFEFYNNNKQIFDNFAKKHRAEYEKYLKTLGVEHENIALVDGVTAAFSSNSFLKNFYNDNLKIGFYLCNHTISNQYIYNSYFESNNVNVTSFLVELWELFLSSSEPPICGIENAKPVYTPTNNIIETRQNKFKISETAICNFCQAYYKYFEHIDIDISSELVFDMYKIFEKTINNIDKNNIRNVYCSNDVCNLVYTPILATNNIKNKTKIFVSRIKRKLKYFLIRNYKKFKWQAKVILYKNLNIVIKK